MFVFIAWVARSTNTFNRGVDKLVANFGVQIHRKLHYHKCDYNFHLLLRGAFDCLSLGETYAANEKTLHRKLLKFEFSCKVLILLKTFSLGTMTTLPKKIDPPTNNIPPPKAAIPHRFDFEILREQLGHIWPLFLISNWVVLVRPWFVVF